MNENKPIIAERIKSLRKEKGLTQEQLAEYLGLNAKSSIANYESGANSPSDDIKKKMCELFNCTMDYLMGKSNFKTANDEIQDVKDFLLSFGIKPQNIDASLCQNTGLSKKESEVLSELLDYSSQSFDNGNIQNININSFLGKYPLTNEQKDNIIRNYVITLESQAKIFANLSTSVSETSVELLEKRIEELRYYMCPVYGQISAGQPNWAEECIEGRLPIDVNLMNIIDPEECFFLRVNGESMNKVVKNGAFALIRKTDWVENGEIAVVLVNGYDATLKKFSKQGDLIILEPQSTDSSFETQVYTKDTEIRIIGKYIGKMEMK